VEDRATGTYLGEVGIYHGEGYPAPELGLVASVLPEAEGIALGLRLGGVIGHRP
jgi:hypothetical protein